MTRREDGQSIPLRIEETNLADVRVLLRLPD